MNSPKVEIVIVEENPDDAEVMMRVLRKHSLASEVAHVKDGVEALDLLLAQGRCAQDTAQGAPKVVLLDLKLPKGDGLEVLRRLKSDPRTRAIPVVVLTSSAEERDLRDAYALGANSYVAKPVRREELAKIVLELGLYWLKINRLPA